MFEAAAAAKPSNPAASDSLAATASFSTTTHPPSASDVPLSSHLQRPLLVPITTSASPSPPTHGSAASAAPENSDSAHADALLFSPPNSTTTADTRRKRPRYELALLARHGSVASLNGTAATATAAAAAQTTAWETPDDPDSPYGTVQAFEATYRQATQPNAFPNYVPEYERTVRTSFPICMGDRSALLECLSRIELSFDEARDMFSLFGDRVAPYIPWLFDTDFSDLPSDPLFALSALQVISRYLPEDKSLCSKLNAEVLCFLKEALFDDPRRPYPLLLDTMKGLCIVYAYAQVGTFATPSSTSTLQPDLLSVKGVVEGYAVRKILNKPRSSNAHGCIFWLWLYVQGS